MPHGFCLRWDVPLLFVFICGNIGIAIAYFLIPAALRYFVRQRADLPYPHMFRLFAAFILSCGITHVVKVWTLYQPVYWIEASIDLWTAGISLVTAFLLFPLIPKVLALRSPKELEELNAKLQNEVEERKLAEVEARRSRDEAVRANLLKSQFVANISHEIRTPMFGVVGLVEVLLMDPQLEGEQRLLIEHLSAASQRLVRVLSDLLDFSKLEAGRMELNIVPFSLEALVSEVVGISRAQAQQKNLELSYTISPDMPKRFNGDSQKIVQTLLNLTLNAIKFTRQGTVQISVEPTSKTSDSVVAKFSVSDTGIGIPESARESLFMPFTQVDGSITREFGGTGLGLSICRRLVELMGGAITVESKVDRGSTFSFSIPLQVVADS